MHHNQIDTQMNRWNFETFGLFFEIRFFYQTEAVCGRLDSVPLCDTWRDSSCKTSELFLPTIFLTDNTEKTGIMKLKIAAVPAMNHHLNDFRTFQIIETLTSFRSNTKAFDAAFSNLITFFSNYLK